MNLPIKTGLTVLTFAGLIMLPVIAPALKNYKSLEPRGIASVLDFPLRKIPDAGGDGPGMEELRAKRLAAMAPKNLIDPTHELDHFYESLLRGKVTRIVHYGDSPTTGDLITADARAMLQQEFGDAGAGFVLIARPWAWYNHRGVEMEASNWKIDVAGIAELKDGMHGLGAVSFRGTTGAVATWRLRNGSPRSLEIAYLSQPDGGAFSVEADGVELGTTETASDTRAPGFVTFAVPDKATKFTLRVTSGSVRLYGAEFRKGGRGVIYSSLGINGANVTLLSHSLNESHWIAELRHYKPDLIVVNYGTNESGFAQFVDTTWAKEMREVVRRLHAGLPGVSILLMSPMDRGEKNDKGEIDTIAAMPRLVDIESKVAAETGTAFFNTFQAMGGEGTMGRWYAAEPRLVGADYIHPMPAGAKIVGELLYSALRDGYNQYKLRQLTQSETGAAPQKPPEASSSDSPKQAGRPQSGGPKE